MRVTILMSLSVVLLSGLPAAAAVLVNTGNPDGLIGTLSRPAGDGHIQTETADDFILSQPSRLTQATFFGLLPTGVSLADVADVEIEFYHVFPVDSASPASGNVTTRTNSPSDVEITSATREAAIGQLVVVRSVVNPSFTVANSVFSGVNKLPNTTTGGEGPVTGQEVLFTVTFTTPVVLAADHYFFRPEVEMGGNNEYFLWLSSPRPIVSPGIGFSPDLQSWMRNDSLAPDWARIGTDITQQGPFNAAFTLSGDIVPEPGAGVILLIGVAGMLGKRRRKMH